MIRNYNGNVNRATLRDLKKLCEVNAENFKNLSEAYAQNGEVSFYTNLDPFTGCPDEMSEVVTLKSEKEIKEYLKKDFIERLEGYLNHKRPAEDYLLKSLIDFLKENGGVFPNADEMKKLEKEAETKRVSESSTTKKEEPSSEQMVLKEILELAEEIMESRRETKPDDIFVHVEPYHDELGIQTDKFYANIQWDRYYGNGDSSDYSLTVSMRDDDEVHQISFYYQFDGNASISAVDWCDESIDTKTIMNRIINIHKDIVDIAEKEGLEFISEVDYEKISA